MVENLRSGAGDKVDVAGLNIWVVEGCYQLLRILDAILRDF